jgi:outer membrane protein
MKMHIDGAIRLLALAAAVTFTSSAAAQSAGGWFGVVGANKIMPKVESGNVSAPALPGSKVDVGNDTKPVLNIGYMLTDNISAELDLGLPYKHDLFGAGSLNGTGKLGTAEVLPPTALLQYRFFAPEATIRPFIGLGVTYAYFQKERGSSSLTALLNTGGAGTSFELDNKAAVSAQLGVSYRIDKNWFAGIGVIKTKLKTTAHYSTGQTQEIKLDPLAVTVGIGYKF